MALSCVPLKKGALVPKRPSTRRRRYLMKIRMQEWENVKLTAATRMESAALPETLPTSDLSIRTPRKPRYFQHRRHPNDRDFFSRFRSVVDDDESYEGDSKEKTARLAELEALEACYWLRAAGFPQYAQLYEDGGFPIDTGAVIKEHDFLDEDSIQSLYRRLQTLNRCSKMNLHIKHSEGYDSDEEDLITLSSRWKLQNKNRKWARRKRRSSNMSNSETSTNSSSNNNSNRSILNSGSSKSVISDRGINSTVRQLSLQAVDNGPDTLSPLDLSIREEGRSSMYDNIATGLSLSTPSISQIKDIEQEYSSSQKSNLANSDLGLESYSGASSGDELSDVDRFEDEDVPGELVDLKTSPRVRGDLSPQPRTRRLKTRWHSFEKSVRPFKPVQSTKICNLSVGQLAVLRKYSLLKLTALMERHTHSHRGMWNWSFPRFLKKFKTPDYRDKKVFGVPMSVVLQRSGQPLPRPILCAINYLQRTCVESVGIFRKSGGKQRINNLKDMMEDNPEHTDFEGMSPYDLADMLKQYFRDLPDPILTSKLAETFITIHTYIPAELRVEAMQAAILLMPDENREALQTLLLFLNEVAENSAVNQMNEKNLGVCFAPSLFHLCGTKEDPSAPKRQKRTPMIKASKELTDNLAAHECLTQMIAQVDKLFLVPEDTMMKSRFSYIEQSEPVTLEQLGRSKSNPLDDYRTYIESCINGILKEAREKFKGWVNHSWHESSVEVSYKKVRDGCPLRLWRGVIEIDASPEDVLKRIVDERHLWDEELEAWDVLEKIDEDMDVFYYVTRSMILQPKRIHVVLRARRTNLAHGACALVCTSISHPSAPMTPGVQATLLAQRYLIEPLEAGRSRLTHITRLDQKGRASVYYNKVGPFMAASISKVKDSFPVGSEGPETNV